MNTHSEVMEPATPVLSCNSLSFCRTEDSGYHTFTPGSIDCSELSPENIDPVVIHPTICEGNENHHKYYNNTPKPCHNLSSISENNENFQDKLQRRGVKRPYHQTDLEPNESYGSIPTPTSIIAGQIQKLKVNESGNFSGTYSISPISPEYSDASSIYNFNGYSLSFPSTPIKKICKSSCKLNRLKSSQKSSPLRSINNINQPPRKFARQLDFETHSLSCEPQSLQAITHLPPSPAAPVLYKPNQKIDIIKLLSKTIPCIPAIEAILSFLSPVDTFNFTLVSPTWHQACVDTPKGREKWRTYLRLSKENQENIRSTPKVTSDIRRKLKDIHNIEHVSTTEISQRSPPTSPRSMRFKMFARSASLDVSIQLACVRCQQPAKVTKDPNTGEIWAACTRVTCAYQFCKLCSCDRHPGKSCIRFDLEGPSPSKRKKKTCAAGSRQSKSNLRRLLIK